MCDKSESIRSLWTRPRSLMLAAAILMLAGSTPLFGQPVSREYIYFGSSVIAIERGSGYQSTHPWQTEPTRSTGMYQRFTIHAAETHASRPLQQVHLILNNGSTANNNPIDWCHLIASPGQMFINDSGAWKGPAIEGNPVVMHSNNCVLDAELSVLPWRPGNPKRLEFAVTLRPGFEMRENFLIKHLLTYNYYVDYSNPNDPGVWEGAVFSGRFEPHPNPLVFGFGPTGSQGSRFDCTGYSSSVSCAFIATFQKVPQQNDIYQRADVVFGDPGTDEKCHVVIGPGAGTLFLVARDNATGNGTWRALTPGANTSVDNAAPGKPALCQLYGANARIEPILADGVLKVELPIQFKPDFKGAKHVRMMTFGSNGVVYPWSVRGVWTPTP